MIIRILIVQEMSTLQLDISPIERKKYWTPKNRGNSGSRRGLDGTTVYVIRPFLLDVMQSKMTGIAFRVQY
jgi:hypothetical protein